MLSVFLGVVNVFIALALPLGMLLYCLLHKPQYTKAFLAGMLSFLVAQILVRIPLLQLWLQRTLWFNTFKLQNPMLYLLFMAFTAGLFEEGGRYLVMRLLLKKQRRWGDGIALGLGHGGLEAIYILGVPYLQRVLFQTPYLSLLPPFQVGLAGAERLSVMVIQVGLSLVVLQALRQRKWLYLPVAILLHTAVDFLPLIGGQLAGSLLVTEGLIALFAVGFALYIAKTKPRKKEVAFGEETC